jgi:hypothetical protein
MTTSSVASESRTGPPYRSALAVAVVVLIGYVFTLAPTVTFWDAGELIAAQKVLGIPHPPGTPLFVLIGHVWGTLFPFGEFAWRTNLLSAVLGAAAAGFWFLVLHEAAARQMRNEAGGSPWLAVAAAAAGTVIASFTFTNWQNSIETEVYSIALFSIAAIAWTMMRWRAHRATARAGHLLLLVAYLLGITIGNHLLGLLVGPAIIAFMVAELREHPAADTTVRREEWSQAAVLAGLWALLTGVGLGSLTLSVLGGLAFAAAAVFAATAGRLQFTLVILAVALVGVTPYLFLYIRSAQLPALNESAPATWDALLGVIRREQYPVRTPLDDPTQLHGPDNPGRNLTIIGLQLLNYVQYFDWQWAKAIPGSLGVGGASVPVRTLFTLAFSLLAVNGLLAQWKSDRSGAWLLLTLWFFTGLGLMAYMNFKPGFSVGYDQYPRGEDHEVRERDYFFVVSFVVWGLWAGLGLLNAARALARRVQAGSRGPVLASAVFAAALVPFALNFRDASRRHGPDARLAADFAYDMLNSVPPYGILFTYGDNDTFPLWWAQEVEGIRQDVLVVCLALAETEWYMRQLRDYPARPFDEAKAPAVWRGTGARPPDWPAHTMTDEQILAAVPQVLPNAVQLPMGRGQITLPANTVLYGKDFVSLRLIQQNFGRRPVGWGLTALGSTYGLDSLLVQRGMAVMLDPVPADTTDPRYFRGGFVSIPLDLPITRQLVFETFRYADILNSPPRKLESTAAGIASTLGVPLIQFAQAAERRGDTATALRALRPATLLNTNPAVRAMLDALVKPDRDSSAP